MKCEFCGHSFEENMSRSGCSGCPMSRSCKKIKCPNCNYEMLPEPEHKAFSAFRQLVDKFSGKNAKR